MQGLSARVGPSGSRTHCTCQIHKMTITQRALNAPGDAVRIVTIYEYSCYLAISFSGTKIVIDTIN